MIKFLAILSVTLLATCTTSSREAAEDVVTISRRAIVVFYPTGAEMNAIEGDEQTALDDFLYYLGPIKKALEEHQFDIPVIETEAHKIVLGDAPFRRQPGEWGFILFDPSREPKVIRSVELPESFPCMASGYFGLTGACH